MCVLGSPILEFSSESENILTPVGWECVASRECIGAACTIRNCFADNRYESRGGYFGSLCVYQCKKLQPPAVSIGRRRERHYSVGEGMPSN